MSTTPATANRIGLARTEYVGGKSTLCTGCGHDSISNHIISAFFQSGINPYDVAKMSGIGCSSKTPGYWLSRASGLNSIHGRMAPCATGAKAANRNLIMIGVSGDGDTASIGLGGFAHLVRRNLPIAYVVANNGVYGLTKGQFSATADLGAKQKSGTVNPFSTIDLCSMAIDLGCTFVARSFSGDAKQLVPLLMAALKHNGTAFIDVISPCITFANHEGSRKSFAEVKEHSVILQELGFVHGFEEKTVDYAEGTTETVAMEDGSLLTLRKLDSRQHDIHDGTGAISMLRQSREKGEILTGLFYVDTNHARQTLMETLNLTERPLAQLSEKEARPPREALAKILNGYR
ncbi:MAG: 2-oxoacid:ferredoxin oxidoreductase subunit beta [Bdellovibrionaceae bacterium]|nr:2-oxoacid:ferredoxin oxidoreductase subunit beta [Pseudobdellovibrionaceae bacterium]